MNKSIVLLAAAGMVLSSTVNAAEANLAVSADVQATCSVSAATLAFGTYDTISGAAVDKTTAISFTCSNGTTYSVSLNNGLYYDSTVGSETRRMNHSGAGTTAADYLTYKLYEGTGTTTIWDGMSGSSTGATQSVDVTGRIDSGQTTSKAGTYSDTVVITVTAS
jgi:spore coat protein U-like protein